MGVAEIGAALGVSRQHVYRLIRRADFPAPVAELAHGRIWLAEDVEAWQVMHPRRPGRPETPRPH